MGHHVELTASDGHRLSAYIAEPDGAPRGGIVVIQPAEHGFNCTDRASFEPTCSKLAFGRSVEFLRKHVG